MVDLNNISELAHSKEIENRKYLKKLKRKKPKTLDNLMKDLHDEEFQKRDCLSCANCCRTTGPLWTDKDINRVSRHFKMKYADFVDQYLLLDEDNDMVLKSLPCVFLMDDNKCLIYEVRPKACAEYPHTNRKSFHKINTITLKNIQICPATYSIIEKLKQQLPL